LYYQFDQGERTETQRRSGPGAPRTQATEENLDKLRDLLIEQDYLTEDEMAEHLKVSHGTVANMISEIGAKKTGPRAGLSRLSAGLRSRFYVGFASKNLGGKQHDDRLSRSHSFRSFTRSRRALEA